MTEVNFLETINFLDLHKFVVENWRDANKLSELLGLGYTAPVEFGSIIFTWGIVPQEKAEITLSDDLEIVRVRTWSGLNWNQRNGYGTPMCDVKSGNLGK